MNVVHAPFVQAFNHRPLELGFLSPHNPFDRRSFSGTVYFASRALAAQPDVKLRILGRHHPPGLLDRLRRQKSETRFEDCAFDGLDAVVGMVASPLLDRLAAARPDLPFLHVTDATPKFLREAYGWSVPAEADEVETRVARQAALCVFSSGVMADRAAQDLGTPDLRAAVQPFGVNMDVLPVTKPVKPPQSPLNLAYVGIDWERKGGDIAVAALDQLLARGVDARLTIVGRCPEHCRNHPAIRVMGFLNKNRRRDAALMGALYSQAHLLLVPSRADCTPMVIAEAMAHGTPVLACDVGGIPTQIGGTGAGQLMPLFAEPGLWADRIQDMTGDADRYRRLSDMAFEQATTRLNWQVWARRIADLAREVSMPETLPVSEMMVAVGG